MKQYRVTYTVNVDESEDCVLDPNDPLNKMKDDSFLGNISGVNIYEVYPEEDGYDRPRNPYSQT